VNHAAIDLGGKESQICIRRPDGTIVEERRVPTRKLAGLVATWTTSRIVMETCAEAFRVADAAIAAGHEVRVVPATLVRLLGVGERGVKNDQRDAQQLSKASWQTDVPSVHIPSKTARELKSICGARDVLVATRTKLINNVRGWMRTQLWKLRGGTTTTFGDRVRGEAASMEVSLPEHIERQLRMLSLVIEEVKAADKQMKKLAGEHPVCCRLMTVPGIGPLSAVRFVAAIDDPRRFPTAHRVQSYLGLTPGEHSSSERERRTGITKAGPMALRRTLIQAAWATMCFVRTSHPMIDWARRVAERRGKPVAAVALARKLAGILFAMWRDGTTYQSKRSAEVAKLS
jgi:transposase